MTKREIAAMAKRIAAKLARNETAPRALSAAKKAELKRLIDKTPVRESTARVA